MGDRCERGAVRSLFVIFVVVVVSDHITDMLLN